ncbi:hypothetical protein FHT98_1717 [Bosea sp. AK1]|uniref:DUF4286 family protein n=1 Tax=Bosea sp. AK1 TaxID=2587160 RepID=UPI0011515B0B|nr:DUF4286 family protein [Bosea sp. AK1]TQI73979.1 hypothetical protein FHT98_1717 [Bosea sp. AK1]
MRSAMPSASATTALLGIWHDVEDSYVEEYLRWHSFEHLPERLALPGFVSAERHELIEGPGQRFCCFLDVKDREAFRSPDYQARLDSPTEWTRRLMPRYSRIHRALCEKRWEMGTGLSGVSACIRIASNGDETLRTQLHKICSDLLEQQAIARARLGEIDQVLTNIESEEKRLRRNEDAGGYDLVLLVEGLSVPAMRSTVHSLAAVPLAQKLCHEASIYSLSFSLRSAGQFAQWPASNGRPFDSEWFCHQGRLTY